MMMMMMMMMMMITEPASLAVHRRGSFDDWG
jgi:hypothetical protein